MSRWISLSKNEGISSRQAHTDLPENTYERELGKEGFFGPATQIHHRHPPTSWSSIEGPLLPRAFDTTKLNSCSQSPWDASVLLNNSHTQIRFWQTNESMQKLVRNSDGDDLLFIHEGRGDLYCDYGHLEFCEGDYIMIPRGTMWRIETDNPLSVLMIEATETSYGLPDKGLVGQHAIFDPAMLDSPKIDNQFKAQQNENECELVVKRHNAHSHIRFPFNPLDAVGWHGSLMPVKINWRDIRPLMSHRYHLPPSAHTTFLSDHFVVCTFCPRPIESDPDALKVPFFHNNEDYDEVLFYHKGQFFSRDNIHPGMLTLHPSGLTHGPHPNAFETGKKALRKETDEVAVMIDTRAALRVAGSADDIEWKDYVNSWKQTAATKNSTPKQEQK